MILLTIFLGLVTVLLSHRVAGPAYRLTQSLERILKGDYGFEVRLRRKDYLQGMASQLNLLIVHLRDREEKLKALDAEAQELREMIKLLSASADVEKRVESITVGLDSLLANVPVSEAQDAAKSTTGGSVASPE